MEKKDLEENEAIQYYKKNYCHFCPIKSDCGQTNLEMFNCMLKEQIRLTERLKELEGKQ